MSRQLCLQWVRSFTWIVSRVSNATSQYRAAFSIWKMVNRIVTKVWTVWYSSWGWQCQVAWNMWCLFAGYLSFVVASVACYFILWPCCEGRQKSFQFLSSVFTHSSLVWCFQSVCLSLYMLMLRCLWVSVPFSFCCWCWRRFHCDQEVVNAMKNTFHMGCFLCCQCHQPIGTGSFHNEDGKIYCPKGKHPDSVYPTPLSWPVTTNTKPLTAFLCDTRFPLHRFF